MVDRLGWPSLETRRSEHKLSLFYKIINGATILDHGDFVQPAGYFSRHDHDWKFQRMPITDSRYYRSFFPSAIRKWNALPGTVVGQPTLAAFASALTALRA